MGNADVTLTWDDPVTPHRPGIDELGGGAKENRSAPPNPKTSPTAQDFNQLTKQMAAIVKTLPAIKVSVHIATGVPGATAIDTPGSNLGLGGITVVDNGVGNTTVKWAKGKVPLPSTLPNAFVNGTSATAKIATTIFSDANFDGVIVDTKDKTDAALDIDFTVVW